MSKHNNGSLQVHPILPALVIGLLIVALAGPLLVSKRERGGRGGIPCDARLNQIGKAIKTYLTDWDGCYPTNRPWVAPGKLGPVSSNVKLSREGIDPATYKPYRGDHGITWVEGLYHYVEPVSKGERYNLWKCPDLSFGELDTTSPSAATTYVFNRNLVEKAEADVRSPQTLMVIREVDWLVDSALRPLNDSTKPNQPPVSAFLTSEDLVLGKTRHDLHGQGSSILFADGHVKRIPADSMPDKCVWDPKTESWGNADGTVTVSP